MIRVPDHPKTGDVVEWWTLQPHPIHFYIQRHRAEFYQKATCVEVLGSSHKHDFVDQWLVTSWYEPSGGRSAGGRLTTAELRTCFVGESSSGVRVCETFAEARALLVEHHKERAASYARQSKDCARLAEEAIQMTEPPARKRERQ